MAPITRLTRSIQDEFTHFSQIRRIVGVERALRLMALSRLRPGQPVPLRIPSGVHAEAESEDSVWVRAASADVWVFDQIFVQREYRPLDELAGVTSIMDLGANVGLASAYLLRVFPKSRVIAVEPDSENFEMLQRNLARFGDRVLPVRGAAWNACRSLRIADSKYRGGGSASVQVTAGGPGEGCVSGFDVPALMDMAAFERVSLLKVDIEGAEVMVFDESSAAWIDRVDNIAIELHDDSSFGMASPVFWRAIQDRGFVCRQSGELVLCVRSTA